MIDLIKDGFQEAMTRAKDMKLKYLQEQDSQLIM